MRSSGTPKPRSFAGLALRFQGGAPGPPQGHGYSRPTEPTETTELTETYRTYRTLQNLQNLQRPTEPYRELETYRTLQRPTETYRTYRNLQNLQKPTELTEPRDLQNLQRPTEPYRTYRTLQRPTETYRNPQNPQKPTKRLRHRRQRQTDTRWLLRLVPPEPANALRAARPGTHAGPQGVASRPGWPSLGPAGPRLHSRALLRTVVPPRTRGGSAPGRQAPAAGPAGEGAGWGCAAAGRGGYGSARRLRPQFRARPRCHSDGSRSSGGSCHGDPRGGWG